MVESSEVGGKLLSAHLGKIGLGLGAFIAPLSLLGGAGTAWNNWGKWQKALIYDTPIEKTGALMALTGDVGATGVNAALTLQTGKELIGLLKDIYIDSTYSKKEAASLAWSTRGPRFLKLSIQLTPWGLAFTALQLGGEVLFNYASLEEEQRWLLYCIWGNECQGWDWSTHSQRLAEINLLPTIFDNGITHGLIDGESVRSLHLVLPGLTQASFDDTSLRWEAELQYSSNKQDVSEALHKTMSVFSVSPLTLALKIPQDWQRHNAILLLRLAVKPALASTYLNADKGYLNYRVALGLDMLNKPIKSTSTLQTGRVPLPAIQIKRESLDDQ